MSFGARDSKQKAREKNKVKEYEVIMDEEIEFVQALQMPGTISDKVNTIEPTPETVDLSIVWLVNLQTGAQSLTRARDVAPCLKFPLVSYMSHIMRKTCLQGFSNR